MLTIISWLWTQPGGRTKYTAEHVDTWAAMVSRNLSMPHRIACVTDEEISGHIERIRPPGDFDGLQTPRWRGGRPSCYRRLAMFRRDAAAIFGERIVCMDLDCVIGGQLDPLFDRPEDLVLFKGTSEGRPYNGSMMMIRAGSRPDVYEQFSLEGAIEAGNRFIGSDQSWLSHILGPNEPVWDERDGAYWYGGAYRRDVRRNKANPRVLFFPGAMKPWMLPRRIDPYITQHYRPQMKEAA